MRVASSDVHPTAANNRSATIMPIVRPGHDGRRDVARPVVEIQAWHGAASHDQRRHSIGHHAWRRTPSVHPRCAIKRATNWPRLATMSDQRAWRLSRGNRHLTVDCGRKRQSGPRSDSRFLRQPALEGLTRSARTDSPRQDWPEQIPAARGGDGGGGFLEEGRGGGQELGITDSACKNQLVVVSIQYGPFNPYIPIRSTTIGKSRVAKDPIAMHTSWRSNSDITSVTSIGYPRMSASGESSTTMHRLLHASGSHPIPTPYDPKRVGKRVKVRCLSCRVSMKFRVVRTNQYNQDLGLIHSTNGNHLVRTRVVR
ncbi:hypothetical protein F511_14798 [Dorcoceras hygrometricum]|uniref:Uncharacterized protein n=1 Tax=Dorcoceras hygrometricum TaxID=472368 RepID=A0A2Z7BXC3_9LAMI|nr:hypothetical protein F511_14798 [Dorcoceras hygrometricum]